ncbi:MAG: ornithine carbamoyltransferase [Candidatus Hodarchaeales archaeon]|jgi:ornithine carbamoyltransferase
MDLTGKHLLTLKDYSKEEIQFLLNESKRFKEEFKQNEQTLPLNGKSLCMIFQKRSTRTRVSTEVAMTFLGGHPLFLGKDDIHLGINESLKDTSIVLSRYCDGILARVFGHNIVEELAEFSSVPIINALSDKYHPLQILADLLTIEEHCGKLEGLTLAWVGDGNNVLNSLLVACPKMGINIMVATPTDYKPDDDIFSYAEKESKLTETAVLWTNDPKIAVNGADIIVTDTFISMGQEEETKKRKNDFKGYQVNAEMVKLAKPDYKFMHCLPRKQDEVTDEIFYSDHSIAFDEAENRMHTVMAVLNALMAKTKRNTS